jgi:hypothetical protein
VQLAIGVRRPCNVRTSSLGAQFREQRLQSEDLGASVIKPTRDPENKTCNIEGVSEWDSATPRDDGTRAVRRGVVFLSNFPLFRVVPLDCCVW